MRLQSSEDDLIAAAALGTVAPAVVVVMMAFMGSEAEPFLSEAGIRALGDVKWLPSEGHFGVAPLVVATVVLALLAGVMAVLVGTLAALRLAFFAGRRERFVCEGAIVLMGGLPSVVVGLAGLAWVTPTVGFSVFAAVCTLFVMVLPTYTLLTLSALRQESGDRLAACRALGLTDRQFAYGEAMAAIRPAMVMAATIAVSKGLGEATAVSLVIGNVTSNVMPGLFSPANTLSTVILKDHASASGMHYASLYALGIVLALLILALYSIGQRFAHRVADRAGVPH